MADSSEILQLIESIAATSSKNEKEVLVKRYAEDSSFVRVLEYTYNPFKTYGIRQIPERTNPSLKGCDFGMDVWRLLDDLANRTLTGNAARDRLADYLHDLNAQSAELLTRIIRKDLRAGFSESTINKAVKGLIPDFPYMRCSLPKDARLAEWPWADGVISQLKADGMFANVDHEHDGAVSIRSRQGSEFPIEKFDTLVEEIRTRLARGHQNHGEIVIMRGDEVLERQIGNGMLNSVLNGGNFEEGCRPVYQVWDQIPLSAVTTKGKHNVAYRQRLMGVIQQLKAVPGNSIELIQTRIVKTLSEAYAHAAEVMKQGKEGTVVKHPKAIWKDGTSKEQVKIKLEFEVDLKVVGIVMGRDGTKNEGRAGSLACVTSDEKLYVDVAVKNEAMRDKVDANPDDWIGRVIAVTANDIMEPSESSDLHSLFLPRMVEASYRADKTEADSLERVFAQKEAAIFGKSLVRAA